jgi:hypothetical protein
VNVALNPVSSAILGAFATVKPGWTKCAVRASFLPR